MVWYLEEFVSVSKKPGWVGWDGKGREVMGWEWGWGEVRHVEKVAKYITFFTNKSSPGIIVAPFWLLRGSLWHPWGSCLRSSLSLGGAGAFLGQSSKKIRKSNGTLNKIDAKRAFASSYLPVDVH